LIPDFDVRRSRARAVCAIVVLAILGLVIRSEPAAAQQLAPKRSLANLPTSGCAAIITPVTSTSSSPLADDSETRRLISAGQEASLQGDHAGARDAFAQAAKRSPQNAMLAYYLGREHEFLGSNTDAVREYCKYLQLSPNARDADEVRGRIVRLVPASQIAQVDEARANFSSGVALLERRQYVAADSIFGSIATKLPNTPEPYYNRALSRAARGERAMAMEDFQKYLDLSGNPPDRSAINTAVAGMQDRVYGSGQALTYGIVLPGLGQMSTGRPFLGLGVLGAVAGILVWGLAEEQGFEVQTFTDPFGNTYVDSLPVTTRPNAAIAATAAGVLWGGAAYEAMSYARRTRARAESILQVGVPGTDDASAFVMLDRRRVGAGLMLRIP
jgi:tetratricopeptide (TPR) repeat protein